MKGYGVDIYNGKFIHVYIFDNHESMSVGIKQLCIDNGFEEDNKDYEAVVFDVTKKSDVNCFGIMVLNEEDLSHDLIAHESLRVAFNYRRRFEDITDYSDHNEQESLCQLLDIIVFNITDLCLVNNHLRGKK